MTIYHELGTVSSGTMRPEDLIPKFLNALKTRPGAVSDYLHSLQESPLGNLIHFSDLNWLHDLPEWALDSYLESDSCGWDMEALFEALNEISPPLCYFGAREGDGADYGFWVYPGAVQEAQDDPDIHVDSEPPPDYWLRVSDHGNLEYYERENDGWKSIWSAV